MRSDDVEEEAMQRLRIRREEEDDKKWKGKISRVEMGGSGWLAWRGLDQGRI